MLMRCPSLHGAVASATALLCGCSPTDPPVVPTATNPPAIATVKPPELPTATAEASPRPGVPITPPKRPFTPLAWAAATKEATESLNDTLYQCAPLFMAAVEPLEREHACCAAWIAATAGYGAPAIGAVFAQLDEEPFEQTFLDNYRFEVLLESGDLRIVPHLVDALELLSGTQQFFGNSSWSWGMINDTLRGLTYSNIGMTTPFDAAHQMGAEATAAWVSDSVAQWREWQQNHHDEKRPELLQMGLTRAREASTDPATFYRRVMFLLDHAPAEGKTAGKNFLEQFELNEYEDEQLRLSIEFSGQAPAKTPKPLNCPKRSD